MRLTHLRAFSVAISITIVVSCVGLTLHNWLAPKPKVPPVPSRITRVENNMDLWRNIEILRDEATGDEYLVIYYNGVSVTRLRTPSERGVQR